MSYAATVTKTCPTCQKPFTITAITAKFADIWGIEECGDCVLESLPTPCNICDEYLTSEELEQGFICFACRNDFP